MVAAHSKGRLEAVLGAVKEEYGAVEIKASRDYQKWLNEVSSTRCEGIEAAGVIPVALASHVI